MVQGWRSMRVTSSPRPPYLRPLSTTTTATHQAHETMNLSFVFLCISLALLLLTKLADGWTTVRHIGKHGESNPLARCLFDRFGFAGGIAVVMLVWSVIVGIVYATAWSALAGFQVATAITGLIVSWVQWDVARFNATRRPSRITRLAALAYDQWARNMAERRRKRR